MIITKTPFRISFFGGGTDFPDWYRQYGGNVLSTSIDKYCYITCRHLPPFFEHKHRIVYSLIENIKNASDIKHPAVKGIFDYLDVQHGLEIHHDGDLPARSGLGSSSSFTAGLYLAMKSLSGEMIDKYHLAKEVIHIEQNIIHDIVGSQDQIATVYGGLNHIEFMTNDDFSVSPIIIPEARKKELNDHLMLFFTGVTRFSSDITGSQIQNINNKALELKTMQEMVPEAINILSNPNTSILEFGKLLHESWSYKKQLSEKISNNIIDDIYQAAIDLGAEGGKVLGAGGGGFILIFAKPEIQPKILNKLSHLICVPFKFEDNGASVAYYKCE